MRCPACRAPGTEIEATCSQCGFSLEVADRAFGVSPILESSITAPTQVLKASARRQALKVISNLEKQFPQISLSVVINPVPEQAPATAYAFWLFNRGQLSTAMEKGGDNRRVLLLIDPTTQAATVMLGYGLEPFIKEAQMQTCLQACSLALERGKYAQAIEAFGRELARQFADTSRQLPKQFGYTIEQTWLDASQPSGLSTGLHDDTF